MAKEPKFIKRNVDIEINNEAIRKKKKVINETKIIIKEEII